MRDYLTICLLALLLLARVSGTAQAQATSTPTPTATYTPYSPPTGAYATLRISPSPFPTSNNTPWLDTRVKAGEMADTAINAYRFINFGGVIDWILFLALGFVVLRALLSLIKQYKGD